MPAPLCFVLLPSGRKPDPSGRVIDFDAAYREVIAPALEDVGLEALRGDQEALGGPGAKPAFERLILCTYAVADLTAASPGVFYALGARHAARPASTVCIVAEGSPSPSGLAPAPLRPYRVDGRGLPDDPTAARAAVAEALRHARAGLPESPVYQLVERRTPATVDHEKTDVFRDRVAYGAKAKERLAEARRQGPEAVRAAEAELGPIGDVEAGLVIDLLLSYRAVGAWDAMIDLVAATPRPLADTALVQEQLAFALNRAGRGERAEQVLFEVLHRCGPSSETLSLLGRVYKDRWEAAAERGDGARAEDLLRSAVDAYRKGFEADWRDAYPGVNAVTLMEFEEPPDPRRKDLLPIVAYAVERKIASGRADYWDYATRLELAVLARDEAGAEEALADALAAVREPWEPQTTGRNLRLLRECRERRGEGGGWAQEIERRLEGREEPSGAAG